jgi:hypothetical protein
LATGDKVFIRSVGGVTAANNTVANPYWVITVVSSTSFTLDDSTFASAWTSGGTVYPALAGAVDGDKFTALQLLDILNEARWALIGFVIAAFSDPKKQVDPESLIPGWIVHKTDLTFASGSVAKPSGYVGSILLTDVTRATTIGVLSPSAYTRAQNKLSATNPAVEDRGTVLYDRTAGTNVIDAATYILDYFGLTDFQRGDILQISGYTQTTEPLDQERHETLLRGAIAIAQGKGAEELNLIYAKELGL